MEIFSDYDIQSIVLTLTDGKSVFSESLDQRVLSALWQIRDEIESHSTRASPAGEKFHAQCKWLHRELCSLTSKVETSGTQWLPMNSAPRDGTAILAWCVHESDAYFSKQEKEFTTYAAHCDGLGPNVKDGPNVVVWGGEYREADLFPESTTYVPPWWFLEGSQFEIPANPVAWTPIPASPKGTLLK